MDREIKAAFTDAVRYWERGRVAYNIGLALLVVGYFVRYYFVRYLPHSADGIDLDSVLTLFVLAVLANVAYSLAYVVDVFMQLTDFAEVWRKRRWMLFALGFALAVVITRSLLIGTFVPS